MRQRRWPGGRRTALRAAGLFPLVLAGCAGPISTPVDWWHDLQGGEIAAYRPPPPGARDPYPGLATVPARPVLPAAGMRRDLQAQLTAQRDTTQRVAAADPIVITAIPPPRKPPATLPETANATLDSADAPPPKAPSPPAAPAPSQTRMEGAAPREADPLGAEKLPPIPDAPPPPAAFEGVAAEPAPTPAPPVPESIRAPLQGTPILFRAGQSLLQPSQTPTLKDMAARRTGRKIQVTGFGDAASAAPEAQAAAIRLGLDRAESVARGLAALDVPQADIRLAASAFGRGAAVRLIP